MHDLDDETRRRTAAQTASVPAGVPAEPLALSDERRFTVPVTLLMGGYDRERLEAELAEWGPWGAEFSPIADPTVVTLGSGHWPQFSMPRRLATAIVDAIEE